MSFKDKVEGNELDLSLNELTVVPVKELAAIPKATHLDLSRNLLQTLPNDFASLTHLVQLDLSCNKLIELPHNFGNLQNLQHLELDKNSLKTLPISFCRLRNLRWLDLKDNPLEPKLQSVAGDCIDAKQCQQCAKKVVAYMQTIESNLERERQKQLKEKREKEAIERANREKEMEEHRRQKKLEKERRKAESKARQEEKSKDRNHQNRERDSSQSETDSREESGKVYSDKRGINWSTWFLIIFTILICGGVFMVTRDPDIRFKLSKLSKQDVQILARVFVNDVSRTASNAWEVISPYTVQVKALLLSQIHGMMLYVSQLAADFESMLSVYF